MQLGRAYLQIKHQERASHQHRLAGRAVSRLLDPPRTAAEAGRTSPGQ